jgi:hypothetical protein
MSEEERWGFLLTLDETLLTGGVILSEWCTFLCCESDTAYAKGMPLASILTAMCAIETYLRSEYPDAAKMRLMDLIDDSGLPPDLISDLHTLRKYRNQWVHVGDPWDDQELITNPHEYAQELERMALLAAKSLRRTIYSNQWI